MQRSYGVVGAAGCAMRAGCINPPCCLSTTRGAGWPRCRLPVAGPVGA